VVALAVRRKPVDDADLEVIVEQVTSAGKPARTP
jgi:hypothetical protein